nr:MAG TPA: TM helix protein [Caudoviricetes sp.]
MSKFSRFLCAFIIALFAWLVNRFLKFFLESLDCRCSPFQEPFP